jgi:hypothetical protein
MRPPEKITVGGPVDRGDVIEVRSLEDASCIGCAKPLHSCGPVTQFATEIMN